MVEGGIQIGGMILDGMITALHSRNIVGYHVLSLLAIFLGIGTILFWNFNRSNFIAFLKKTLKPSADIDRKPTVRKFPPADILPLIRKHLEAEDESVRLIMQDIVSLAELIRIISAHDDDFAIFKTCIYPTYTFEILHEVISHYPEEKLLKFLQSEELECEIFRNIYTLAIVGMGKTGKEIQAYSLLNKKLLAYLKTLKRNLLRLESNASTEDTRRSKVMAVQLLRQEIDTLMCTALIVSITYTLRAHGIMETDFVMPAIRNRAKMEAFIEILQDVLPHQASKTYVDLLKEERLQMVEQIDMNVFSVWSATWIEYLAKFIEGTNIEKTIAHMIERIVVLKAVPVFSETTADELFQISLTTRYQRIPAGQIVIREGNSNDEFYVMDGEDILNLLPPNSSTTLKLIQALASRLRETTR
jgi:hypothetical protein